MRFPREIAHIVGDYAQVWTVRAWVLEYAPALSEPLVYSDEPFVLDRVNQEETDDLPLWADNKLLSNPHVREYINGRSINWYYFALNPADWALDLLEAHMDAWWQSAYVKNALCQNSNPRALGLLRGDYEDLDWGYLSINPNAIPILQKHLDRIDTVLLLRNPAPEAEELCRSMGCDFSLGELAENRGEWAINIMKRMPEDELMLWFCWFRVNPHPWAVEQMKKYSCHWLPAVPSNHIMMTNSNPDVLEWMAHELTTSDSFVLTAEIWANPGIFELTLPDDFIAAVMG